jgi:hypothetical protein
VGDFSVPAESVAAGRHPIRPASIGSATPHAAAKVQPNVRTARSFFSIAFIRNPYPNGNLRRNEWVQYTSFPAAAASTGVFGAGPFGDLCRVFRGQILRTRKNFSWKGIIPKWRFSIASAMRFSMLD